MNINLSKPNGKLNNIPLFCLSSLWACLSKARSRSINPPPIPLFHSSFSFSSSFISYFASFSHLSRQPPFKSLYFKKLFLLSLFISALYLPELWKAFGVSWLLVLAAQGSDSISQWNLTLLASHRGSFPSLCSVRVNPKHLRSKRLCSSATCWSSGCGWLAALVIVLWQTNTWEEATETLCHHLWELLQGHPARLEALSETRPFWGFEKIKMVHLLWLWIKCYYLCSYLVTSVSHRFVFKFHCVYSLYMALGYAWQRILIWCTHNHSLSGAKANMQNPEPVFFIGK